MKLNIGGGIFHLTKYVLFNPIIIYEKAILIKKAFKYYRRVVHLIISAHIDRRISLRGNRLNTLF
jgi:hypothetical protein